MNVVSKIINKIFTNRIQTYIREIAHPDQVDFIPQMKVWYNIHKSINVINHLSELKNKNQIIISMDVEKAFDKVYHIFMIKVLERRGLQGTYISIIKDMYENHSQHYSNKKGD